MLKPVLYSAAAAAALAFPVAISFEPTERSASAEALDPTRLGRLACRGLDAEGGTLASRLMLAEATAAAQGTGTARMPLLDAIPQTGIPATGLAGEARRYFDQGVMMTYGFNHAGAIRSFREAQRLAPGCAMCFWGEASANGPNINAGMGDAQNKAALAALEKAETLAASVSPVEQALIAAQVHRYSSAGTADRAQLDAAYADAMIDVASQFADNDDIAILAAESAMNTTPWNYWNQTKDAPQPRIGPAIALLEKVMARNPTHPQASHLYIHVMENSADPTISETAADRLVAVAPTTLGHLVHMPAHIYHRIGRYTDSMKANVLASRADEIYLAQIGDDGLYRYGYYPHNVHFLLTSAQMAGDMRTVSLETERLARVLNVETARALPWVQAIHAAPSFALAQYASPAAILALTDTPTDLHYVEAMRRYARAIAYAQHGSATRFGEEIAAMEALRKAPEVVAMTEGGFPAADIIELASLVAQGRNAHWRSEHAKAVSLFERAEAIEKTIPYTEPPYWYYPVAQSRGAALYSAGRYEEAREAFRKALFEAPNSGWALYGLAETERKLGHAKEAEAARTALARSWAGDRSWLKMSRL